MNHHRHLALESQSSTNFTSRGRDQAPRLPPPPLHPDASSSSQSPRTSAAAPPPPGSVTRPLVPVPITLRAVTPQHTGGKGVLKIHIANWDLSFVKPPRSPGLTPVRIDPSAREPPTEDTVFSGALEIIMKERRRAKSISVGVHSACRLDMGAGRGWEEDGIFERGVEVMGGTSEGIWLEKGSQSFGFSILLPATLATSDTHEFGFVGYILTARVEGVPYPSSIFPFNLSSVPPALDPTIPNIAVFKRLMDRSSSRSSRTSPTSPRSPSPTRASPRTGDSRYGGPTGGASGGTSNGREGSAPPNGLYHRSQSRDINLPSASPGPSSPRNSPSTENPPAPPADQPEWLKGDLWTSRYLVIHANASETGGATSLNMRRHGYVDSLGVWKYRVAADVFAMASIVILTLSFPNPSPRTTIFSYRLLLSQTYNFMSPRTPGFPPHTPQPPTVSTIYEAGVPLTAAGKYPGRDVKSLWRGAEAGGDADGPRGWKDKALGRLPDHYNMRPSTRGGSYTPIHVKHEFILHVFYSVEGESARGEPIKGPGELRRSETKCPVIVPSCCCTDLALELPSYDQAHTSPQDNIDAIISSPMGKLSCMCFSSFEELRDIIMKKTSGMFYERDDDDEEGDERGTGPEAEDAESIEAARAKAIAEGRVPGGRDGTYVKS
ncbi:hypothetical protein IAT38_008182 [Cryptococcus sp. DSM 104549]